MVAKLEVTSEKQNTFFPSYSTFGAIADDRWGFASTAQMVTGYM